MYAITGMADAATPVQNLSYQGTSEAVSIIFVICKVSTRLINIVSVLVISGYFNRDATSSLSESIAGNVVPATLIELSSFVIVVSNLEESFPYWTMFSSLILITSVILFSIQRVSVCLIVIVSGVPAFISLVSINEVFLSSQPRKLKNAITPIIEKARNK